METRVRGAEEPRDRDPGTKKHRDSVCASRKLGKVRVPRRTRRDH